MQIQLGAFLIMMKSKIILLLAVFVASNAFAYEVKLSSWMKNFYTVTITYDKPYKSGFFSCFLLDGDKPITKVGGEYITGTGELSFHISQGVPDDAVVTAECELRSGTKD